MESQASDDWEGLRNVCRILRAPGGCGWDREQSWRSLTPYLLEETHEVLDAISSDDPRRLAEEIGDLLYLLVFLITIAEEQSLFRFEDVARGIVGKLIRRHPQIFAAEPGEQRTGASDRDRQWETIKRTERDAQGPDLLARNAAPLPALLEAYRTQEKAAAFGFDWPAAPPVLEKLDEERAELARAMALSSPDDRRLATRDELGDLLFTMVNLARHLGEDPEQALRGTIAKFRTRFARMAALLESERIAVVDADLQTLEGAWQRAKAGDAQSQPEC